MPKLVLLWGLVAIYAGSTVTAFVDEPIRVKNVLDQPGLPLVRILGACDITARGATCWDTEGKPFKSLGEWITAYYITNQLNDLTIKPGAKNRWVAIERETGDSIGSFDQSALRSGYLGGFVKNWRTNTRLEWVRADIVTDNKFTSVPMSFREELPSVHLELKRGATAKVGDHLITVVDFGLIKKSQEKQTIDSIETREKYIVRLKLNKSINGGYPFDRAVVLAHDGSQIQQVDDAGKPARSGTSQRFLQSVELSDDSNSSFDLDYKTNVQPQFIGSLEFKRSVTRQVVFEGIPIDPNP
ncbi:hypothetical protein MCEMSE15_02477 [Fimbriimonadaceae bacterium]